MSRMVFWLQQRETRMFRFINHRIRHNVCDSLFQTITHMGGATWTILASLCLIIFGHSALRIAGIQSLIALTLSHIPVAIVKKKFPRLRPYLVLPQTNTCSKPLKDHSFPSGHTTAIFAVTLPLCLAFPPLVLLLLPLAITVAVSRIYLGLHYPSDCLAGCAIGSSTAILTTMCWNLFV